jgi:hypothetical protein
MTYIMNFMKIFNFIKLYFIVLPIALLFGLWIAFCTLLEHIIEQYKIK